MEPLFQDLTSRLFGPMCKKSEAHNILWPSLRVALDKSTNQDPAPRFQWVSASLLSTLLSELDTENETLNASLLLEWSHGVSGLLRDTHDSTFRTYLEHGSASHYPGNAARRICLFVRDDLNVPFSLTNTLCAAHPWVQRMEV